MNRVDLTALVHIQNATKHGIDVEGHDKLAVGLSVSCVGHNGKVLMIDSGPLKTLIMILVLCLLISASRL